MTHEYSHLVGALVKLKLGVPQKAIQAPNGVSQAFWTTFLRLSKPVEKNAKLGLQFILADEDALHFIIIQKMENIIRTLQNNKLVSSIVCVKLRAPLRVISQQEPVELWNTVSKRRWNNFLQQVKSANTRADLEKAISSLSPTLNRAHIIEKVNKLGQEICNADLV